MTVMNQVFKFKLLNNCPDHIPSLAKLWFDEISKIWNPDASVVKAEQKLATHLNSDKLPMAFVALYNDQPVGMACLRENDGIKAGISPWLGSLVVDPNYRRHKVGEMLINVVKDKAKKLGYQTLYLLAFDATIREWYAKLGWEHIGYDELFRQRVTVMSITL